MAKGFETMKSNKNYRREVEKIEDNFEIEAESDEWWTGKKS